MAQYTKQENLLQYKGEKRVLIVATDLEQRHIKNVNSAVDAFTTLGFNNIQIVGSDLVHKERKKGLNKRNTQLHKGESVVRSIDLLMSSCPQGLFTVYVTGHGQQSCACCGDGAYLNNGDRRIQASELSDLIHQKLGHRNLIVIADQCYGFDFLLPFVTNSGAVGISASERGRSSYNETFPQVFFPALAETGSVWRSFERAYREDENRKSGMQYPQFVECVGSKVVVTPNFLEISRSWLP